MACQGACAYDCESCEEAFEAQEERMWAAATELLSQGFQFDDAEEPFEEEDV